MSLLGETPHFVVLTTDEGEYTGAPQANSHEKVRNNRGK